MELADFVKAHDIKMVCAKAKSNPNMEGDAEWNRTANHWSCKLKMGTKTMTVPFSMGSALRGLPTIETVLDSLASDASSYENARDFEDWASEYGFDTDSRKAEKTYNTIGESAKKLSSFLGSQAFSELLEAERL